MIQAKARILVNEGVAQGFCRIDLKAPEIASQAKPGQFVHVRCGSSHIPLLRRPFSIARIEYSNLFTRPGKVSLIYKVVGEGTKLLSQCQPEEELDILGPLGNGFNLDIGANKKVLVISGGIGIASLIFLIEEFSRTQNKPEVYVLFGEKDLSLALYIKGFLESNVQGFAFTTEEASFLYGIYGGIKVTELLEEIVIEKKQNELEKEFGIRIPKDVDMAYACGPKAMLKEVAKITAKANIPCQVSLESYMACGVGACLGCVIKTKDGYKRVCKDGPVFDAKEVIWDEI